MKQICSSIPRRTLGRSGLEVSTLSIGAMRLPGPMDEAVAVLRKAIDAGCNYIDTSRGYGDSELKIAQALKDGYRERVILSTKCSPWVYKEAGYTASADDCLRKIDDSMKRLEVDRLDFYQVWNIETQENYQKAVEPGGIVDGIRKAMDRGLVSHIGATTHAPEATVFEMIDSGIFEAITVTYHLLDRSRAAVMERAHAKNVGIVVMNPIGGGMFGPRNAVIENMLPGSGMPTSAMALRYVLDNPHTSCAISGFNSLSDVEQNAATSKIEPLTPEQVQAIETGVDALRTKARSICTACNYCMPCQQGVEIRRILRSFYFSTIFNIPSFGRRMYSELDAKHKADLCNKCGECEKKCTNKIPIREELVRAHELFKA